MTSWLGGNFRDTQVSYHIKLVNDVSHVPTENPHCTTKKTVVPPKIIYIYIHLLGRHSNSPSESAPDRSPYFPAFASRSAPSPDDFGDFPKKFGVENTVLTLQTIYLNQGSHHVNFINTKCPKFSPAVPISCCTGQKNWLCSRQMTGVRPSILGIMTVPGGEWKPQYSRTEIDPQRNPELFWVWFWWVRIAASNHILKNCYIILLNPHSITIISHKTQLSPHKIP